MNLVTDNPIWQDQFDRQAKLLYSLIVAGKSANFADKVCRDFLYRLALKTAHAQDGQIQELPFSMLRAVTSDGVQELLRSAKTGNYGKLCRAFCEIGKADLDLNTVTPQQLETIHGIGPKTSRFFIIWTRPEAKYAALDVHVLRWLGQQGYEVPKSTPQNPAVYARLETVFIAEAEKRGLTPRELDRQIWEAGAGRTQESWHGDKTQT